MTVGFRAYSTTNQIFPNQVYEKVAFVGVAYDTSGRYDAANSRWTPVTAGEAAAVVHFSGQLWFLGGVGIQPDAFNSVIVAKLIKNGGVDCFAGIAGPDAALPGTGVVQFSGDDLAQPGDYYELVLYVTASPDGAVIFQSVGGPGTVESDNNPAHVFWCGSK